MMKAGKKTLKIIAATAVASFSLVAAVVSTMAWFLAINTVKESDVNIEVDDPSDSVSEITFHKYRGLSTDAYYLFNPDPEAKLIITNKTISIDADPSFTGITLDTYTSEERHHPLLMLLKLKKKSLKLYGYTKHPFLAAFKPEADVAVASYAALTYVNTANLEDGTVYLVTNDEQNGGLSGTTYGSTAYQLDKASDTWELVWVDLAATNNPLSSVVETFFFTFTFATPQAGATTTHTLNGSNPSSIAIKQSDCNDSNVASFVKFENGSYSDFSKTVTFFKGTVSDDTVYLGIVLDYYSLSLEYISSYFLGNEHVDQGLNFTCDWGIGL